MCSVWKQEKSEEVNAGEDIRARFFLCWPGLGNGKHLFLDLKIPFRVFLSGLLTGCLLSKARGHRTSLRHQLLLILFPKVQACTWEHHLRPIPQGGCSKIPLHSQTRGNLKGLEIMCGHFALAGMFSVQVPS